MIAIASLLLVVLLAMLVTRVATVILTLTGMSREAARFQARSALTGVGFTTTEAEAIVNHPVRRRVVMWLMLIGSAGVITVMTALILSLVNAGGQQTATRIGLLVGGLVALIWLAHSRTFGKLLEQLIGRALTRWTDLDARDYAALLHLSGDYTVTEVFVEEDDWVADRPMGELDLPNEGVRVLGIVRPDGGYVGAPVGSTVIRPGDTLVMYGRRESVTAIDRRKAGPQGDEEHRRATEGALRV